MTTSRSLESALLILNNQFASMSLEILPESMRNYMMDILRDHSHMVRAGSVQEARVNQNIVNLMLWYSQQVEYNAFLGDQVKFLTDAQLVKEAQMSETWEV